MDATDLNKLSPILSMYILYLDLNPVNFYDLTFRIGTIMIMGTSKTHGTYDKH